MDISPVITTGQAIAPVLAPIPAAQAAENRQLIQTVKALNASQFFGENRESTFSVDRATRRPIIRIVDTKTNEVVEQLPAEYLLQLARDADSRGK
ncbi:MAG: flagellar protein FlaG [Acidobacteriota bacterium]|nr:flagellar protein FlaG [Acidobacteriota bacterium]